MKFDIFKLIGFIIFVIFWLGYFLYNLKVIKIDKIIGSRLFLIFTATLLLISIIFKGKINSLRGALFSLWAVYAVLLSLFANPRGNGLKIQTTTDFLWFLCVLTIMILFILFAFFVL